MNLRTWPLRATLVWALLALVFAVCEYALPLAGDTDELPEHSLNRPHMAARIHAAERLRR